MTAFHVDRFGRLTVGAQLERQKVWPANLKRADQLARLDAQFPTGLSRFGITQLFERAFIHPDRNTDQEIELTWELVRRLEFPNEPSRLAAIYASATLDEAGRLRDEWLPDFPAAKIVELDAEHIGRYDSELLDLSGNGWDVLERSRAYWRGDASPSPKWELLLEPPAHVAAMADWGAAGPRSGNTA
jgi:hypothetical protein